MAKKISQGLAVLCFSVPITSTLLLNYYLRNGLEFPRKEVLAAVITWVFMMLLATLAVKFIWWKWVNKETHAPNNTRE